MKSLFLFFVLSFSFYLSAAQEKKLNLVQQATTFTNTGNYEEAIATYQKLLALKPKNFLLNYNLACIYSIQNEKDSAFKFLFNTLGNFKSQSTLSDPDFINIHNDPRWDSIEQRIFIKSGKRYKDYEYAKSLWRLGALDQAYYHEIEVAEKKYGHESKEVKALWKKKNKLNEQNLIELEQLISIKGWPKRSQVFSKASSVAFLIIQHSNIDKMKKYLPIIKEHCDNGEGDCKSYAMLYDRIKTFQNQPQLYGTQIKYNKESKKHELFPLANEAHIDEYRDWAGLGPIEDYVKSWDIKLNLKKVGRNFAYADSLILAKLGPSSKSDKFKLRSHSGFSKGKILSKNELNKLGPRCILGSEIEACLSMPMGTEIIVMFTDNQIVDYPNQPDIYIKECGGSQDKALISVSNNGINFDSLGIAYDGRTSSLDLAKIGYTLPVKYIKIISLNNKGAAPGYDLIYVKGLPGSNVDAKMTITEISQYLKAAKNELDELVEPVAQKTKKIVNPKPMEKPKTDALILEEIKFDSRSARIQKASLPYLNKLSEQLKSGTWRTLELTGHTDDQGTEISNEELSLERARAIKKYLIQHGVPDKDIRCFGQGATQPIMSNETKDGRAENRRVELRIID